MNLRASIHTNDIEYSPNDFTGVFSQISKKQIICILSYTKVQKKKEVFPNHFMRLL